MKLTIARSELLEALSVAGKGMSARSTLPILSGVLLSARDGEIQLQSTDLEVSVKHTAPALIENDGQVVIPGRLLTDIVRNLPEAAVTLETEGDVVAVRCQQSSFTVKTLNPADFPKFPEVSVERSVVLPVETLVGIVRQVSKAVSRDETRAVLTGIMLVIDGHTVRMVATDSYRLAVREVLLDEQIEEGVEVVIPARALEEVTKIAAGGDKVKIGLADNQILFEFETTTFVTRRLEGNFPNYKNLLPKESETVVVVPKDEFTAAVKRVSLMAQHNTPLKLSVNIEDQTLSLSATTQDIGDASEDLMVKAEGRDVDIAFNHAFLSDGLASAGSENIRVEIQSSLKPGLLKTEGDEGFLYLLMPVRLG